jgi:hypothetical protein
MLFDKKFAIQIIQAVINGENLFHMMRGFLNILARVKSEERDKAHTMQQILELKFLRSVA